MCDIYKDLSDEKFDALLQNIIDEENMPACVLLSIPGIYEILREHYNNEVLSRWEEEQAVPPEGFSINDFGDGSFGWQLDEHEDSIFEDGFSSEIAAAQAARAHDAEQSSKLQPGYEVRVCGDGKWEWIKPTSYGHRQLGGYLTEAEAIKGTWLDKKGRT